MASMIFAPTVKYFSTFFDPEFAFVDPTFVFLTFVDPTFMFPMSSSLWLWRPSKFSQIFLVPWTASRSDSNCFRRFARTDRIVEGLPWSIENKQLFQFCENKTQTPYKKLECLEEKKYILRSQKKTLRFPV